MAESFRNIDTKAEKCLAEFMDSNFYSKLHSKSGNPISFERKVDKYSQLNGVDVEIVVDEKRMYIDEKAAFYYSNAMIPTFAFEIDSIQKGHDNPVVGWFINDKLQTDYYMLIWPNVKCDRIGKQCVMKDLKKLKKSDFTIIEAMLINKKSLLNAVYSQGLDSERLIEYAKRIRKLKRGASETYTEEFDNYIKIMYSGSIAEQPINAVIRKELLKQVATGIYLISEDGYAVVKG